MNKEFRKLIWSRSKGRCERCRLRRAEHMHHLTYIRRGHELPQDIQHVCLHCHGQYHPQHNFKSHRRSGNQKSDKIVKKKNIDWRIEVKVANSELRKAAKFNRMSVPVRRSM